MERKTLEFTLAHQGVFLRLPSCNKSGLCYFVALVLFLICVDFIIGEISLLNRTNN